jgi:hypothetical protein
MKVTSMNHQLGNGEYASEIWWGTATVGADKLEWFYEPGSLLDLRREDRQHPGMWYPVLDLPQTALRAVLSAIKAN